MCHPAPVQLHYLAAGTQTGGSHSLGLFISETLSFWGPEASASTSVRVRGGGRTKTETERVVKQKREKSGREIRGTVESQKQKKLKVEWQTPLSESEYTVERGDSDAANLIIWLSLLFIAPSSSSNQRNIWL